MAIDVLSFLNSKYEGAQFLKAGKHYIPLTLTPINDIIAPYKVGFFYPRGVVRLTGPGSKDFLQGVITNDVGLLDDNDNHHMMRSLIAGNNGKILYDCVMTKLDDDNYLIYSEPGIEDKLAEFLEYYHIIEDLVISVDPPSHLLFIFDGSQSLWKKLPVLLTEQNNEFLIVDFTKMDADTLLSQGVQLLGIKEFDEMRPIFSFSRSGMDFDSSNLPQEASLSDLVSYTKGCFLGQEPISRMYHKGRPTKVLRRFISEAGLVTGNDILLNDKIVGWVTSPSSIKTDQGWYNLGFIKTIALSSLSSDDKLLSQQINLRLAP
ncbi:MAG: hypothetical protein JJV97_01405 [SAR324 cluster bacterium]|nr:hypothetical protein [SAR324 cluster bacterium]